ncbi:hypothetical protein KUCAC02_020917 [Chaenocephalus aceratus]|uniref:Uncharacterized protein n=1 Tax=Chaenocephalus aceratus TaxID=36190 RepID=A0ACB9XFP5_CHAAC|nr:hypothetical protein KUCAC02_020917 [Chaenocephalus aceratus]
MSDVRLSNGSPTLERTDSGADGQMECTEQCTGLRKRPACHEPSAQNKRSHSSSEEVTCPSLSHSTEKHPEKPVPRGNVKTRNEPKMYFPFDVGNLSVGRLWKRNYTASETYQLSRRRGRTLLKH